MIKVSVIKRKGRKSYYLRYLDPDTLKPKWQSSGKRTKREAYEEARKLEESLNNDQPKSLSWAKFCLRYEAEHVAHMTNKGAGAWQTARNHFGRMRQVPVTVQGVTPHVLAGFTNMLRREGMSKSSIHCHLARIRAALNWAKRAGIISGVPEFNMPKLGKTLARARAITLEEFERLLTCVPDVRPLDPDRWVRFLKGLWESGFRLSELLQLSWSPDASWSIQANDTPLVRVLKQKNGDEQYQPITPEFWQLLKEGQREGYAFPIAGKDGQMTEKRVTKVIAAIGRKSKIITNPQTKKTVTSHDLRRSFAVRMGSKLTLLELSQWMRHSSAETTKNYYHVQDAETLASRVW